MKLRLIFLFAIFYVIGLCSSKTFEHNVREAILTGYDKMALPANPTNVSVRFTVLHFDMNEAQQSMDLDVWVSMEWNDPRMRWSSRKYPHIKSMAFHADSIWKPDLFLYNNALPNKFDPYARTDVLAMNDGVMIWVPPAHIKSMCVIDMTMWPYDIHNCTAKFGSWVHASNSVNVTVKDDTIMFEEVIMNHKNRDLTRGEWNVLGSSVVREAKVYVCCPEEYVNIQVSLLVQRNSPAYKWLIQIPALILCIMTLVVFLLPPSAGEKIVFGGLVLILDFVFLLMMSRVIGHAPNNTPLILQLISKQCVLTAISIITSALVLRLIRDPHSSGMPSCLKPVVVLFSSFLCLGGYRQMVMVNSQFSRPLKSDGVELSEGLNGRSLFSSSIKNDDNDWVLLAAVIDRIGLICFFIVFIAHAITYMSVL